MKGLMRNFGGSPREYLSNLIKKQGINRYYNPVASHLQVREQIVKWIKYLAKKLSYSRKTLHLSIAYLDSVFSQFNVEEDEYKLICFVCLYMAAKM